jgi:hypothetical protein
MSPVLVKTMRATFLSAFICMTTSDVKYDILKRWWVLNVLNAVGAIHCFAVANAVVWLREYTSSVL